MPPNLSFGFMFALAIGAGLGLVGYSLVSVDLYPNRKKRDVLKDVTGLIGNTPMIRINSLSELTGCDILGKCEFLNPGGSVKDRIALEIIREAEQAGRITPNTIPRSKIYEGTSGSTGISLAFVARALGYEAEIVLPDDTATEKSELISKMGGEVIKVRPVGIANRSHYVNVARERAQEFQSNHNHREVNSLFIDQFDNPLNWLTHYKTTAPEIWNQTNGKINIFVSGVGTGGTISGIGKYLKQRNSNIQLVIADPPGSGLYNKVKEGVMFSETEIEGKRRRHQMDSIVEGIGLNRLTYNFQQAMDLVDDAIRVTDQEAIFMSRYLVEKEGLFLGSSSAVNLVASFKLAKQNKQTYKSNKKIIIVCILCDGGQRHLSKFWSDEYLIRRGFKVTLDSNFDPLSYF